MAYDVKLLVAGDDSLQADSKGDIVSVVNPASDWGNKTVTPLWVRLTVTGVTGDPDTQDGAIAKIRGYLSSWHNAFTYAEVAGAADELQRYRIEAIPTLANDLNQAAKIQLRDAIVARLSGVVADQGTNFVEIDAVPGWPLDELAEVVKGLSYRRYRFSDALIDAANGSVSPGEPAEFSRTFNWVKNNIEDKLKT